VIARAGIALALAMAQPALADTVYVRVGMLVDPETGTVAKARLLRIEDGRVAAITPDAPLPARARVIDWSGYTVLPGLIDVHVHIADPDEGSNPAEPLLHSAMETAYIGARNARATLLAGFTTVHDAGCYRAYADVELRNAIDRGDVVGPRMSAVGAYITAPGGSGEVTGFAPDVHVPEEMRAGVVTSPAEVTTKVNTLFQHGADSIKLIATGAPYTAGTEPGAPELTEAEMRAAVAVADARGSWVMAHAHGTASIKAAIRAGVRSVEHASLIDDEGLALAKARGVWLDMDLYNVEWTEALGRKEGWPEPLLRKSRAISDAQRAAFGKAVRAGIRLPFGTDAGVYPHGLNARQFRYMVRFGMTPMQAIQAATTVSAQLLGWSKTVGALSPGHYADMIAVAGDPLADITVLEHVDHVIKGGELVK